MKIAPKPKTRVEFKEINPGDVFTVDGYTSTYLKTEPLVKIEEGEVQYNVNCISLANGNPHWFEGIQKVMPWLDATVTF